MSKSNSNPPAIETAAGAVAAFARTRERLDRLSSAAAATRPLEAATRFSRVVRHAVTGAFGAPAPADDTAANLAHANRILGDALRVARRAAAAMPPPAAAPARAILGRPPGAAGVRDARAGGTPHSFAARTLTGLRRAAARLSPAPGAVATGADATRATRAASAPAILNPMLRAARAADAAAAANRYRLDAAARVPDKLIAPPIRALSSSLPPLDLGARLRGVLERFARGAGSGGASAVSAPPRSAANAPVTINFSPNIKVEVASGGNAGGHEEIGHAVARALESHAEELHNLVLRVATGRERTDY